MKLGGCSASPASLEKRARVAILAAVADVRSISLLAVSGSTYIDHLSMWGYPITNKQISYTDCRVR